MRSETSVPAGVPATSRMSQHWWAIHKPRPAARLVSGGR